MEGILRQRRAEHNYRVEIAWRTANFIQAGNKLPPLKKFLVDTTTGGGIDKPAGNSVMVDPSAGLDAWAAWIEAQ